MNKDSHVLDNGHEGWVLNAPFNKCFSPTMKFRFIGEVDEIIVPRGN